MGEPVTDTEAQDIQDNFDSDMDIFGNLDTSQVGDPFAVDPNTYRCVATDPEVVMIDGAPFLVWKWAVDEPTSDFHGSTVQERHPLFPHKKWSESDPGDKPVYSPEEKRKTKFLKLRLRLAFDLTEEQIAKIRPSMILGKVAFVTTKEGRSKDPDDDRVFTNVKNAISQRLYEEKNGASEADSKLASSMGL